MHASFMAFANLPTGNCTYYILFRVLALMNAQSVAFATLLKLHWLHPLLLDAGPPRAGPRWHSPSHRPMPDSVSGSRGLGFRGLGFRGLAFRVQALGFRGIHRLSVYVSEIYNQTGWYFKYKAPIVSVLANRDFLWSWNTVYKILDPSWIWLA